MNSEALYPLSSPQHAVWLDQSLAPDLPSYNIGIVVQVDGSLDFDCFEAAIEHVVQTSDALRIVLEPGEDGCQQHFAAGIGPSLQRFDFRGEEDPEAHAWSHIKQAFSTPFDLYASRLWFMHWMEIAPGRALWLVCFHHLVSDGMSISLFGSALVEAYNRLLHKQAPEAAVPSYSDFVTWDGEYFTSPRYVKDREFWLERFAQLPEPLFEPGVRKGRSERPFGQAVWQLERAAYTRLNEVAAEHGGSSTHFLMAVLAAYFSRTFNRSGEVVIGMPVHNRTGATQRRTVGMFSSVIPVGVLVDHEQPFSRILQDVAAELKRGYRHQRFPLTEIHRHLLSGVSDRRGLFDIQLSVEGFMGDLQFEGDIQTKTFPLHNGYERQPLGIYVRDYEQEKPVHIEFNFDTGLLTLDEVRQHVTRIERFTLAAIAAPEASLLALPVMDDAEHRLVIEAFNNKQRDYGAETTVHALFEQQVSQTPDAVALEYEGQRLSYVELNRQANQLALYLRELGVQPDDRVALCFERGIGLIVAIVATLKAGGAYVPLDPVLPDERLAHMLQDSAPAALLIQQHLRDRFAGQANLVVTDDDAPWRHYSLNDLPADALSPSNLAYVLYTSGSTGLPKGVCMPHSALVNLLRWQRDDLPLPARTLQFAALGFDVAFQEIFSTLCSGGTLVMLSESLRQDLPALADWMGRQNLQRLYLPYIALNSLSELWSQQDQPLPALQDLMTAGEQLRVTPAIRRLFTQCPQARLHNHYGPTESHVVTAHVLTGAPDSWENLPPIGSPIANCRLYLLDDNHQPVPVGVAGEIYIAGVQVARAYLGRPDLSEERFLADPFVNGERMYRTGDLGRWREDGAIDYLGRNDFQVKIRGFRIELGEIEMQLARLNGVREAAVVAREDQPGDKRLVAYILATERTPDPAQLRAALADKLPEYMLPSAFVTLDAWPLTPNGKLNRKALPAPAGDAFVQRAYEAPVGEVEITLAQIWSELLGVGQVGRQDDFFELGGHSLLAIRLVEQLRRRDWFIDIRALFAQPALSALAEAIRQGQQLGLAEVDVPANAIPPHCTAIQPGMLPLIQLDAVQIDRIVQATPGGAANIQDIYPLAPLQEGILFHHLLQTDSDTYVLPTLLRFDSKQRLDHFLAALDQVIARHDILRTAILWEGLDEPVQVVWREAHLHIENLAFDSAQGDTATQLQAHTALRHARIDVRQAPMLRGFVAPDADGQRWWLQLLYHHIGLDHTALELAIAEVGLLLQDRAAELPAPVPFRNFVAQARLGISTSEHEAFFRQMLGDVDEATAPFGLVDVQGDGSHLAHVRLALESALAQRLRRLAKARGVSAASVFHLALAQVLAASTGRDDVVFGTVLFGRLQGGAGADQAMGLFINTLPVRARLGEQTVEQGLRQTHASLVALLRHEHAPLALAQRCSALPTNTPPFSALLNYRHSQIKGGGAELLDGIEFIGDRDRTNYPFSLYVDDFGQDFGLTVQVHDSVSAQRVATFMLQSLEALVDALERNPQLPLAQLEALPAAERQQVLYGFNDTATDYPVALLHELVEQQVARTPDAIAVRFEQHQLSYAALNAQANQLARHLRQLGVGPDRLVGVMLERSDAMVIALLAVVKAGGAYVPLDPAYPDDRLAHMLADSAPVVVLTQASLSARLPDPAQAHLALDASATTAMLATYDCSNLAPSETGLESQHLAYVIYTSGSTGQPKGAMNEHRGIVNRLQWMQQTYGLGAQDVVLQKTPFSFDVSVWEFFWPLMSGAQLVVARPEGHKDPAYLGHIIRKTGVTTLHFVPSMLQVFLSQPEVVAQCTSIQRVICSGEALPAALVHGVRSQLPQAELHNLYGPTEAAVDVTAWACTGEETTAVPIGRPIANTHIYILDEYQRPVPVGVAGEVYIGGVQVARGYLNRPQLTRERFLADPFVAGGRMYRTGDLGRWRADGAVDYLGRNDFQVKLRGFRIELGEIEAQLVRQPGVREAVVIARANGAGLIAYVVQDGATDAAVLRAELGKHLPDYMIPAAYVQLAALPLSPNGKLDRKALPAPDDGAFTRLAYEAPVGEVEQALAQIWSELLGIERISRHEQFFELGGHSLLAIRLLEQLRRNGWSLDIRSLFAHPGLAGMAAAIQATNQLAQSAVQVPPNAIQRDSRAITPAMLPLVDLDETQIARIVEATPGGIANIQDIYPLAPLQTGILFHHLLQTEGNAYVLPTLLSFDSQERYAAFVAALGTVIARHDILRTAVHWQGLAEPVQVVWREAPFNIQLLAFDGDVEAQLLQHADPRRFTLDLSHAPMLHGFAAVDAQGQRWLLQLLYHHLVMDHTTLEVLTQEIALIQQGRESSLPEPVPYRNFVAHARLGASEAEHEAFFRKMLGDVTEPCAPFGILDVQGDGSQVAQARLTLPSELATRLRRQASRRGMSAASLFHLAWAQVLAQCTGSADVVFGTVLFGRMQGGEGADRAVGMFINTLPLRVSLGDSDVETGLSQVQTALTELLQHEHAALALAQRCSGLPASTPLFSALLNYRHSHTAEVDEVEVLEGVRFLGVRDRTNYPFGLYVDDLGAGFALTAEIHVSVSAQRIIGFMQRVLEGLATALEQAPHTPMHGIAALPEAERDLVLHRFNDTQRRYHVPALVHQAFEQQAALHPERTALELDGEWLSYRQLNEQANQLARHLRSLGVGPDARVAICAERSLAMVIAMVATLKAGGAYVPLDPSYPDERLSLTLRDSQPVVLLTQQTLLKRLDSAQAAVLLLEDQQPWSTNDVSNLTADGIGLQSENLAYVIYTSGSTGVPKGVAMPHRGLVQLLAWQQEQLPEPARTLQFAALGFDVAFQEVFSTLSSGGTLVLLREALRQDLPALAEWLGGQSIERMFLPYIALNHLSELWSQRAAPLPMLQDVITAGEQLRLTPAIRRMCASHTGVRLHNHYGPTETHVVSAHVLEGDPDAWDDLPPIGAPIANSRLYLLDAHRQPVPLGVAGEIYIGGAQVARGYLNRPELTEERFLADPFVDHGRLYKTGDLGRWRADGTMDFLGRNDFQVKLRGYRIELGEIETQLARLPGVREAAVIAREDRPGDIRLVAYVVAVPDAPPLAPAQLHSQLAERLPDYMVPLIYIPLDALPLTPNGKLNRNALPAPEGAGHIQRAYAAPQGENEQVLARIWSALLGVEQIGREDNFFALGGHSLLAVRLVSQVRQQLNVELPLATLFAHPQLAALAAQVALANRSTLAAITPVDRSAPLPLSYAQRRLWFIDRMDAQASAAYHIPGALRLRGPLDQAALQSALDSVIGRHESLRTRFVTVDGQPWQVIDAAQPFLLEHLDTTLPALDQLCATLAAAPFDLAAGPLIRGHLLRLADDDHVLLVTMHHIISDGWSLSVLMREFSAAYRALRLGEENQLPPLAIQYADYAAWQQQWLQGLLIQDKLQACVEPLRWAPALVTLPTDRPRPELQDYRGASIEVSLDAGLSRALRDLCNQHGTTLYMTVLAAWAAVVARLNSQSEVVIGTSHAGRNRIELEPLIGFFVNTQALKIDLDGGPSVAALLAQVRQTALRAQELHEVPFEQVVEALNPTRSMSHHPVFQLMLTWHNTPDVALDLADLAVERLDSLPGSASFDLSLDLEEAGDRIVGQLNYATALFDESTIQRHWGYVQAMLRAMAADQRQSVEQITLPGDAERALVLDGFNATQRPHGAPQLVHTLFEQQAATQPDVLALMHGTQQLSYGAFNAQANQLAHYLRALGVRPDDRVALYMERSIDMMIALMATLKAGGAYVPLDPVYPDERLAYMLQDSAPSVVLTQPHLQHRLALPPGCRAIVIDSEAEEQAAWGTLSARNPEPADVQLDASHLAYVIYTSGSTGKPKGVMVEHRHLWHQAAVLNELYGFTPEDRVLQFCALTFDVSVEEIFSALLHGATLVLRTDAWVTDPQGWCQLCAEHALTVANLPPLFWQRLALEPEVAIPSHLRHIVIGGDGASTAAFDAWWQRPGHRPALSNAYGATETTINVTVARCAPQYQPGNIGRPVTNSRVYVLDAYRQPVPLGVAGELYIGGVQVARGYLNRPELTEERFLADPFVAHGRMYKTGDLGRWRADGTLEFLGRNDFQVKLRGFRVELGEIETQLARLDGVHEAVVIAREDRPGDKRLVAYVVATPDAPRPDPVQLRTQLAERLPEYMVPLAYVPLEALPLTPNGKLDRKALPAPDSDAYIQHTYEAPQGEIEQVLARIWSELLGIEQVGRQDNFFELGGHSLLAVRLISQLRQQLDIELPLAALFAHPQLAELATQVAVAGQNTLSDIVPADRGAPLPLSYSQQRLWYVTQIDAQAHAAYHIPGALRLRGALDRAALHAAVSGIVERHEVLRTRFVVTGGQPGQVIGTFQDLALQYSDLTGIGEDELQAICRQEAVAPFDLSQGPLIRAHLLRLADDDHLLLVTMHHIISDGWSLSVLASEFSSLYRAFRNGQPMPLAPLAIQYADYAAWQREWLQGPVLRQQLQYWVQQLQDIPELISLPTDHPRPATQDYRGATLQVALDKELSRKLRTLSQRHGATLYMTVLGAWAAVLAKLSGQSQIVIGSSEAGRNRAELEPLIGFFVNAQAIRFDLEGPLSVSELLAQSRQLALQAQNHRDVPFEQVVEALNPTRSMAYNPVYQVRLAWQNTPEVRVDLDGLTLESVGNSAGSAQFDLSLDLEDAGDSIVGQLNYATALFEHGTIQRHWDYLQTMLSAMVADDSQRIDQIPLLGEEERELLLQGFNATQRGYPTKTLIHALFEEQAAAQPDTLAVFYEGQQLSYGALNQRANQLAHHLRSLGVRPDDRVALYLDRSIDMVVSLLATLKAGAAYVPLDPVHPDERIAHMLEDSAPVAVLTQVKLRGRLNQPPACPVIAVDATAWEVAPWAAAPASNPLASDVQLNAAHLAYVIYTSGSTGTPKGVMVEHRNVLTFLRGLEERIHGTAPDCRRIAWNSSFGFDMAVKAWGQLTMGRSVFLLPEETRLDAGALLGYLEQHGIEAMECTPSHLRMMQGAGLGQQRVPSLRKLLLGGEAIDAATWRTLAAFPDVAFFNMYGPTECSVDAACGPITGDVPQVGSVMPNARIYLLDAQHQPVPLGAPGEIYIGGSGVARGYLHRPELTAERFVRDPFSSDSEGRMYKTGDLGRWRADGTIEYLGRNDFQVKIRGFRIELGEIEARLARLSGVRQAVVIAREDSPGDQRLVAYIVPEADAPAPDPASLRNDLSTQLPDYMLPASYVALPALPLTPNGKLDRKALPAPEGQGLVQRSYEAPVGEVEQKLAAIWAGLLGAERVGRHDNFFELGGHSALAIQLIYEMSEKQLQADVQMIFNAPSLAHLASSTIQLEEVEL
ncbi:amino acid adenylation domain-containing protein [Duganella sp. CY15W]|uniref:non-ribosomal peptide synthetase n=1 Tax=Duganella sp. CY15W TaxID=2692172 RepID=UPI0013712763|nr:non-ribosomal peptide synthetase [Duganella sp. CY15W]MYM28287.1 amino acid adenylation domain-containing protein [Duganella sp. CY15W]